MILTAHGDGETGRMTCERTYLAMINDYRWTFNHQRDDVVIKLEKGESREGELIFAGRLGAFSDL
jgi:hypothetical protein